MKARYVCSTTGGRVTIVADVTKSVDEVKAMAEKEHKTPVLEVLEELPLSAPYPDFEEYRDNLVALFKSKEVKVKSKQAQRKPKLKTTQLVRKAGRPVVIKWPVELE